MSTLINRILGNLATRMMLIIYVSIVLITSFFIIFSYYNELELQEKRQYDKLKALVSAVAVNIDGDEHKMLMDRYQSDGDSTALLNDAVYHEISNKMGKVVEENSLSPMYTMVYDKNLNGFVYGIRSDDFIDFKNKYQLSPQVLLDQMETGGIIPMYKSENGTWLSAFHPIRSSNGEVVALVEADIDFGEFQAIVNKRYFREVMIALGVIVLFALFLIPYARKVLNQDEKNKLVLLNQKLIIESKNRDLMDSIRYALRIQSCILPSEDTLSKNGVEGFIFHKAKDVVAGDFYWIERHGDELYFAVADCTGHGVPGAILSLVCSNALNRVVDAMKIRDTAEILNESRKLVIARMGGNSENKINDGMDISICRYNLKTKKLQYSGANNPLYVLKKATDELLVLSPNKQPVGNYINAHPFTSHEIQLEEGDYIYLFTDGFADQFGGPRGKKFKYKPFQSLLSQSVIHSPEKQKQILEDALADWMLDYEQVDDISVMGIRV